jgi:hypothetical protein
MISNELTKIRHWNLNNNNSNKYFFLKKKKTKVNEKCYGNHFIKNLTSILTPPCSIFYYFYIEY